MSRRKATRRSSSRRPTIPKSSSAVRPSGSTNRLPPCRSPWKMPSTMAPSISAIIAVRTTPSVSTPAWRMPATSSNLNPSTRCMTRTRRVMSVGCGRGTTYPVWPRSRSIAATSSMLAASTRKSSSSTIVSANSSTSAGGLASDATGMRPMRCRREPGHRPHVPLDRPGDVGALDLDDDLLPADEAGDVHLGDRGGGERRLVERDEDLVETAAEILLDGAADVIERLRRHLVAAALELADELGRKDAFARRDDLAELDERRPERLGGEAQPPRELGHALAAGRLALAGAATPTGPRRRRAGPRPRRRGVPAAAGQG